MGERVEVAADGTSGDETYGGTVGIRMGPVKLAFDGKAKILSREDANSDGDLRHGTLVAVPRVGASRPAQRVADPQTAGHPHQRGPVAVAPEALVADHALERLHPIGAAGAEHDRALAGPQAARDVREAHDPVGEGDRRERMRAFCRMRRCRYSK